MSAEVGSDLRSLDDQRSLNGASRPPAWPGWLLDLLLFLLSPLLLVALAIASRGFTRAKLRRGFWAKLFAFPERESSKPALWIHAVSVGEVLIAEPLVRALRERFPAEEVVLSVATYTGREVAERCLPEDTLVFYAPYDWGPSVARALRRIRPRALLLIELEVWPRLTIATRRHGVPVLVINGRLSERSARGYARLGAPLRSLFRQVSAWGMQNAEYAARVESLGVDPTRIEVLGNLKHDRRAKVVESGSEGLREQLGWQDAVLLTAGCTHPGEEVLLCGLLEELRAIEPRLRLVIAPRHVERFADPREAPGWGAPGGVAGGLVRWTELGDSQPGDRVLVIDTVGELERFYAAADLVVVGGTFVPHGGHNLLEPARLGRPVLLGPSWENFRDETLHFLEHGGVRVLGSGEELGPAIAQLLEAPAERRALGEAAARSAGLLSGSLERHLSWLEARLQLSLPDAC